MQNNASKNVLAAPIICSLGVMALLGCASERPARVVPAQEYTDAVKQGTQDKFSFFDVAKRRQAEKDAGEDGRAALINPAQGPLLGDDARAKMSQQSGTKIQQLQTGGDKFEEQGYQLKRSVKLPETESGQMIQAEFERLKATMPAPPPGSSAPYFLGQMGANPSLWPDESQQSSLFRDLRAFQPMDVVTIVINESVEGQKRTQTDSQSRVCLLAAV